MRRLIRLHPHAVFKCEQCPLYHTQPCLHSESFFRAAKPVSTVTIVSVHQHQIRRVVPHLVNDVPEIMRSEIRAVDVKIESCLVGIEEDGAPFPRSLNVYTSGHPRHCRMELLVRAWIAPIDFRDRLVYETAIKLIDVPRVADLGLDPIKAAYVRND